MQRFLWVLRRDEREVRVAKLRVISHMLETKLKVKIGSGTDNKVGYPHVKAILLGKSTAALDLHPLGNIYYRQLLCSIYYRSFRLTV